MSRLAGIERNPVKARLAAAAEDGPWSSVAAHVAMRRRENTGRPMGDETFVKHLGALLGRDLLPEKRGPKGPRRKSND